MGHQLHLQMEFLSHLFSKWHLIWCCWQSSKAGQPVYAFKFNHRSSFGLDISIYSNLINDLVLGWISVYEFKFNCWPSFGLNINIIQQPSIAGDLEIEIVSFVRWEFLFGRVSRPGRSRPSELKFPPAVGSAWGSPWQPCSWRLTPHDGTSHESTRGVAVGWWRRVAGLSN